MNYGTPYTLSFAAARYACKHASMATSTEEILENITRRKAWYTDVSQGLAPGTTYVIAQALQILGVDKCITKNT